MRGTERVHVDYTLENMEQRNADLLSRADVTDGAALSFQQTLKCCKCVARLLSSPFCCY